jgi:ppGpp synthetase/RelA/SpoT-type nucleotidyltranferase
VGAAQPPLKWQAVTTKTREPLVIVSQMIRRSKLTIDRSTMKKDFNDVLKIRIPAAFSDILLFNIRIRSVCDVIG